MSTEIVRVPFQGDEVECARDERGVWVVVKRVCKTLGIDRNGQQQRLRDPDRSPWATTCMMHPVAADGKKHPAFCIDLDSLPMWLATIDASRVDASARPKLIAYQRECAKALRAYWIDGGAVNPRATPGQASRLIETLEILLTKDPIRHRSMWVDKISRALAQLHGRELGATLFPYPLFLINDIGALYQAILGRDVYAEIRERTGRGEGRRKRYHALRETSYDALNRELGKVEMLALQCRTMGEFRARIRHYYEGAPLQIGFGF